MLQTSDGYLKYGKTILVFKSQVAIESQRYPRPFARFFYRFAGNDIYVRKCVFMDQNRIFFRFGPPRVLQGGFWQTDLKKSRKMSHPTPPQFFGIFAFFLQFCHPLKKPKIPEAHLCVMS